MELTVCDVALEVAVALGRVALGDLVDVLVRAGRQDGEQVRYPWAARWGVRDADRRVGDGAADLLPDLFLGVGEEDAGGRLGRRLGHLRHWVLQREDSASIRCEHVRLCVLQLLFSGTY